LSVVDHEQGGLPRVVAEQQAAGILAIGGGDITDELLDRIAEEGMPLVAVDNYSNHRQLDSVVTDDRAGAYLATRHLIELGHRRIAIILGPEKYKPLVERYHGYRDALNEANIPLDPALIQAPLSQGTPQKGYRETERLLQLDPLPTAIFAVSDRTALGALALLQQRGLRVPEDLSLVGFDNVAPGAHAHPALTTVNRPHYEMGIIAMQRLDMLISGRAIAPTKLVLYVDLIERESTAAPPTQSRSSR
jgi:LacI family transcriptional regulator